MPPKTPKKAPTKASKAAKVKGKIKPGPKGTPKGKNKRQVAATAAVAARNMDELVEEGVQKLLVLKQVTKTEDLFEEGSRTGLADKIKACMEVVRPVRRLKDSYKGRLGVSKIPPFHELTVNEYMICKELTIDDMNEACFIECGTNLAWIDGELQLITTCYYGMDNMTDWSSSVIKDDAGYLKENLRFTLDFLFNVFKLGLRTEKQILDMLKPPKDADRFKGAKLFMLSDEEVQLLMADGEHEEIEEDGVKESLEVLKEMHRFRMAQRLLVLEKMDDLGEDGELDDVEMQWEAVDGGEEEEDVDGGEEEEEDDE